MNTLRKGNIVVLTDGTIGRVISLSAPHEPTLVVIDMLDGTERVTKTLFDFASPGEASMAAARRFKALMESANGGTK